MTPPAVFWDVQGVRSHSVSEGQGIAALSDNHDLIEACSMLLLCISA